MVISIAFAKLRADELVLRTAIVELRAKHEAALTLVAKQQSEIERLRSRYELLVASVTEAEVQTLVADAIGQGKLSPAGRSWAASMGRKDLPALRQFLSGLAVGVVGGSA